MRRHATILICSAIVIAGSSMPLSAAERVGTADAGAEQELLAKINEERTSRGKRALIWHTQAASVARDHSYDMAAEGRLHHNPNLATEMSTWSALGENVGVGMSIDSIHSAFMGSSGHRANILGSFTHVGVGVVYDDGTFWVTEVFLTPSNTSSSSGGSSGGSSASGDRVSARSSGSRSSVATRSPADSARAPSRKRTRDVRAASAAKVHGVAPPVALAVATGTMRALEWMAEEAVGFPARVPCAPRRAC